MLARVVTAPSRGRPRCTRGPSPESLSRNNPRKAPGKPCQGARQSVQLSRGKKKLCLYARQPVQLAPSVAERWDEPVSGMANNEVSVATRNVPWIDIPTPPPITTPSHSDISACSSRAHVYSRWIAKGGR